MSKTNYYMSKNAKDLNKLHTAVAQSTCSAPLTYTLSVQQSFFLHLEG